jgi:hypothetical protein
LALQDQQQTHYPIYSDSANAISWIKKKHCNTKLRPVPANAYLFQLIERAERWLQQHDTNIPVLKGKQPYGANFRPISTQMLHNTIMRNLPSTDPPFQRYYKPSKVALILSTYNQPLAGKSAFWGLPVIVIRF